MIKTDIKYSKQAIKFLNKQWNNIPEIQPDDDDLKMLDGIEKDPDCKSFVSSADAMKQLNLM